MTEQFLPSPGALRIGAVSFLNPVPLVWGMLHGPQQTQVDLTFSLPSVCARQLEQNRIQLGLVPVAEAVRQDLAIAPGVAITCLGEVRSILLFGRVPWPEVRTLAADFSSRTSVQLARIILRERYGAEPRITEARPVLSEMLAVADAALIIGDPALRISPNQQPYHWLDLGSEWLHLTHLPMVFAAWAGKKNLPFEQISSLTTGSYEYGKARIDEIVDREYEKRGITRELAKKYLTQHIRYELGPEERKGLEAFIELAGLVPALATRSGYEISRDND